MTIGIVMPVHARNRELVDMTYRTVETLSSRSRLVLAVMVNRLDPVSIPEFVVGINERTLNKNIEFSVLHGEERCVAATWNYGINLIRQSVSGDDPLEFILVINNDLLLEHDTIDLLSAYGRSASSRIAMWSGKNTRDEPNPNPNIIVPGVDFSCFMIHPNFPEVMGAFDENFTPAYYEDNDMYARMVLSGKRGVQVNAAGYYHLGSQTIARDPLSAQGNHRTFGQNHYYFSKKWGVDYPLNDDDAIRRNYFPVPFNDPKAYTLNTWPKPARQGDFW